MQIFIMLTRLISEEIKPSFALRRKEQDVVQKVKEICPHVQWMHDYVTLGPWDYVDIFRASDMTEALKVSALVRAYGGAHVEIWPAMTWDDIKHSMETFEKNVSKKTKKA